MVKKKTFFREPTRAQIATYDQVHAKTDLVERVLDLEEDKTLVIDRLLIPEEFQRTGNGRDSWFFLRHAPVVEASKGQQLWNVARGRQRPVDFRRAAFNAVKSARRVEDLAFSGYAFTPFDVKPFRTKDKRTRRIGLVETLEGARLFAYGQQSAASIEVQAYDKVASINFQGAKYFVRVPSRTQKKTKHEFDVTGIPVAENRNKYGVAWSTGSLGHDCRRGLFIGMAYSREDPMFDLCAHEIAAQLRIMELSCQEGNKTPYLMSQVALPTEKAVRFYTRLMDSTLVRDPSLETKDQLRPLYKAEKEIMMWGLVHKHGHDETFDGRENLGGMNWHLRGIDYSAYERS